MGFGRGKGFTAIKTSFTGSGLVTTVAGYWRFILARYKIVSTVVAVASGTSSAKSTSGKLTATRTKVVT
jgi:hypothetical protein